MALFNFHKKEERNKSQLKTEKKVEKKVSKPEAKKAISVSEKKPTASLKPKNPSKVGYKILKAPRVTEKATDLLKNNQYVFEVYTNANKTEIKKAVEGSYGVDVESVNVINIPKKKRRLGRTQGWKGGVRKAIVKLKEGQKIEILPR